MKLQKKLLALRESFDVHDALRIDSHSLQRRPMRNRRDDELAVAFESDETSIKEMIDARGQKQSVFAV
jgi:hypothetical protein